MISVILALALAQLFLGVAALVQTHSRVRLSVAHGAWVVSLFLILFQLWWSLWDLRLLEWIFPTVMFSLLAPSLLFLAATLASPREPFAEVVDLREHFAHVRRPLMAVVLIVLIVVTLDGPLLNDEVFFNRLRLQQLVISAAALATFLSARESVHTVAGLVAAVAMMTGWFIRFLPGAVT